MLDRLFHASSLEFFCYLLVFLVSTIAVRSLYAAREGALHQLRLIVLGVIVYVLSVQLMPVHTDPEVRHWISLVAAAIVMAVAPRRSRHIPVAVKRRVVDRYEKRTGQRYDPKVHDIDHIWPFARGGSHKADNLRVISRSKNRRKGNRKPSLLDWF